MRIARTRWTALAVLALIAGTAGCSASSTPSTTAPTGAPGTASSQFGSVETNPAGDIPDNQAYVAYRGAGGLFTVTVPEGWAQTADGSAVVFSDKYNSVRIQSRPAASSPTMTSVSNVDLPALAASAKGYVLGKVSVVQRNAGQAILATYRANSATNPVTGKYAVESVERYVFFRAGHEVILTLAAPVGADNVDPWRKVTDSFGWVQP